MEIAGAFGMNIPLKNKGAIRLTISKYYLPSGKSISDVGLIPDIESVNYGRGVGYEINEYQPPSNSGAMFISASKIRESIKNGDRQRPARSANRRTQRGRACEVGGGGGQG